MPARLAIAVAALFLLLTPEDLVIELFVADVDQAEFVRLGASAALAWALTEAWTRWRRIETSRAWSLVGTAGVAMLAFSLLVSSPALLFFSFPLLVGSTLSALMEVAESWRKAVLARESRGRR